MDQGLIRDSRCRLCLKRSNRMENLFTSDSMYKSIVEDFTGLKIENNTKLPSVICAACIEVISILLEFRLTCKQSQETLENQQKNSINVIKNIKVENGDYPVNEQESKYDMNVESLEMEITEEKLSSSKNIESENECAKSRSSKKLGIKSKRSEQNESPYIRISEKLEVKTTISGNFENLENQPKKVKSWKDRVQSYKTVCYFCGKMYDRFRIQHHINRHLDQRPFECKEDGCGKAFPSPRQLRQHNTYCHSDYAPYACEICSRAFKTPSALKIHKTYHFDPQIPCSLCGKLLRNDKTLKKHMFSHTGERPYKCGECPKSFKSTWPLKIHYSKHHAIEAENIERVTATNCTQESSQIQEETGS